MSKNFEIKQVTGLKGGKHHTNALVLDLFPLRLGYYHSGALKVKCAQDIFKQQGPVNLKVTFTVTAGSS